MQNQPFTVGGAISEGWRLTKDYLVFLIGYQIIQVMLQIVFSIGHRYWWNLIGVVVSIIAQLGLYKSFIMIRDGIKPGFDQLYQNWRLFLSMLVAGILFGLMLFVGTILLIVPGFYVLARYGLFPYFIVDKNLGPIDALKAAAKASEGVRWPLFCLFLDCLGLIILGVCFFVIGVLITSPIAYLAVATAYRSLVPKIEG